MPDPFPDATPAVKRASPPVSNWWYGVVLSALALPMLVVGSIVGIIGGLFGVAGIESAVGSEAAGPVMMALLTFVLLVLPLCYLVGVVCFAAGLALDIRALRRADGRSPTRLWDGVALLHVAVLALSALPSVETNPLYVQTVTALCGVGYLWRRHRRVGRP